MRQKAILLRSIEAMNFIDKQQRALPDGAATFCSVEDFAEISNARENCTDLFKVKRSFIGQQSRDGRFADPLLIDDLVR